MKKPAALFLIYIFCFIACTKKSEDGVFIRITYSTSQDFKEVLTNNKSFENVNASGITSCQAFEKVIDLPFVTLVTDNDDTAYAGAHYYDPPVTYLDNGKYTLKIFEDTSAYYGYNCIYIKD